MFTVPLAKNTLKFVLLLLVQLTFHSVVSAQNDLLSELKIAKEDTNKVTLLNDLCWEYAFSDPELSIEYGKQAIALARKLKYKTGLQDGYRFTGRTFSLEGQSEKALSFLTTSLTFKKKDLRSRGLIYNDIAGVYEKMGDNTLALDYYYKSLRIFEKIDFPTAEGFVKVNMVNIYIYQFDYDKALQLSEEAIEIFDMIGDTVSAGLSWFNKGAALMSLERFSESHKALTKALEIMEAHGEAQHISEVLTGFGNWHQTKGNLLEALDYYERSLVIDDSVGNQLWAAKSYSNIAGIYFELKEYDKAINYHEIALKTARDGGDLQWFMTTIGLMAESYYKNGEFELAHEYSLFHTQLKDSIYSEVQSQQVIEITKRYESEKKDQEIIDLKEKEEISRSENNLYYTIFGLSILALLLVVLAILFYLRHQKSKNISLQRALEQKAFRAQMNPHFIFNSLNSIQRMYIDGKEDIANDYMADFSRLLRSILENSGKQEISLKEELEISKRYMDLELMRTDNAFGYMYDVDETLNLKRIKIPPLLFQPYLENAIWHGILPENHYGTIVISIRKLNASQLSCEISDDGVGIYTSLEKKGEQSRESKGMEITQERLGGESNVSAHELEAGGTKIKLTIDYRYD